MLEHCPYCQQRVIFKTDNYCRNCGQPVPRIVQSTTYRRRLTIEDIPIVQFPQNVPNGHWELCHMCGGNGFIRCDQCDGLKQVVGSMFYETCEKCNGLGQLKCPNCTNGQVWVSTEPLA